MKASELRIGNWVMYSSKIQVNENKIRECVDHPDRFAPIPLNEEWLIKFRWNPPKDIGVSFSLTTDEIHFVAGNYYKKIEYVHQLQNLYFALTGQELNQNK